MQVYASISQCLSKTFSTFSKSVQRGSSVALLSSPLFSALRLEQVKKARATAVLRVATEGRKEGNWRSTNFETESLG